MYSVVLTAALATSPVTPEFAGRARAGCAGVTVQRSLVVRERSYGCVGSFAQRDFRTPVRSLFGRKFVVTQSAPAVYSAPAPVKVTIQQAPPKHFTVVQSRPVVLRAPLRRVCPVGTICP